MVVDGGYALASLRQNGNADVSTSLRLKLLRPVRELLQ